MRLKQNQHVLGEKSREGGEGKKKMREIEKEKKGEQKEKKAR